MQFVWAEDGQCTPLLALSLPTEQYGDPILQGKRWGYNLQVLLLMSERPRKNTFCPNFAKGEMEDHGAAGDEDPVPFCVKIRMEAYASKASQK